MKERVILIESNVVGSGRGLMWNTVENICVSIWETLRKNYVFR